MGLNPQFRIIANDKDITAAIIDRFSSLSLTDESGLTADTLEIVLTDHKPDAPLKLPAKGAELELFLGYDGNLRRMGLFVADELTITMEKGSVDLLTIHARAAPYEGTPKGKTDWQTQKTRSWKNGTTLGDMAKKIATEHGMTAVVSASLASIAIPHEDQADESDISFLVRLSKRYDAVAKPAGGKLVFAKRGEAASATGVDLPRINVARLEVGHAEFKQSARDSAGTVLAYYHVAAKAATHMVSIGDGDPVRKLKRRFKSQAQAMAAITAIQTQRARAATKLALTMPGNESATAEAVVVLDNTFQEAMTGDWLVTRVTHEMSKGGYSMSLDCELPNSQPEVADAIGGGTSDIVVKPAKPSSP